MSTVVPDSREVLTTCGPIVGRRLIHEGDRQVDAFQGIPFAKPPVGELRFKKPVPPEPWTCLKETKAFGHRSIQSPYPGMGEAPTSEDCLTLNVFTPVWQPDSKEGFAVLVYIHGGAFVGDSAITYGDINICKNLVTKDVVVVTIQYRLGYLGMWSTGDKACPGNNNLWDMTLGLKWVKDNISRFNGNPDNITVMGQSAGGAAVDLLSISPHSRDLFHKVIPMAGNGSCYWSHSYNTVETCRTAAEKFGVTDSEDSEKFLEELRKLPADTFALSMFDVKLLDVGTDRHPQNDLGPRIDGDFLPKSVSQLRKEAPAKPKIIGVARSEGLLFKLGPGNFTDVHKLAAFMFPEQDFPQTFKELRKEYLKQVLDPSVKDASMAQREICDAHGDFYFANGVMKNVLESLGQKGDGPVYVYRFDKFHPDQYGPMKEMLSYVDATHCSDIGYLLGKSIVGPFTDFDESDYKAMENMAILFTNFVKHGNPNGKDPVTETWKPATKENPQRNLEIGAETKMNETFYKGRPLWCAKKQAEKEAHHSCKM